MALLRAHVPPVRLHALLEALGQYKAKVISIDALLAGAAETLRPPARELAAAGLAPAAVDLLAAFEAYMRPAQRP